MYNIFLKVAKEKTSANLVFKRLIFALKCTMRKYNKYKQFGKKKNNFNPIKIIVIFLVVILVMAVGYASYTDVLTIFGISNIKTFTVTYNLNGGVNPQDAVTSFDATTNAALPIPTYTDHDFGGWYEASDFSGNPIITTPVRKRSKKFSIICKMDCCTTNNGSKNWTNRIFDFARCNKCCSSRYTSNYYTS